MARKKPSSSPARPACTWRCPKCAGSNLVPGPDVIVLVDRGQGPRPETRSQAVPCPMRPTSPTDESAQPKKARGQDAAAGEREDAT